MLQRLRKHNLKLQIDKCEFLRKKITYLGHKRRNIARLIEIERN